MAESCGEGCLSRRPLPRASGVLLSSPEGHPGTGLRFWMKRLQIREAGEEVPWRMGLQPDWEEASRGRGWELCLPGANVHHSVI